MVSVGKSHPDLNTNSNVANFNPISSIYQHFNRFSTLKKKKDAFVPEKKKIKRLRKLHRKTIGSAVSLLYSQLYIV